jgi:2-dehydropantoate 2-reductase
MTVCVVGLGAVGSWVAARLAWAGHRVSALARPSVAAAVAQQGGLLGLDREHPQGRLAAVDVHTDAQKLKPADVLFIALKGHALAADAAQLAPLIGPQTTIVPLMNGVPWWFMAAVGDTEPLRAVDPLGAIAAAVPLPQTLGAVVHLTCSTPAPGQVRHGFGERLILGELLGEPLDETKRSVSTRVNAVAELLESAGFTAERSQHIRSDIWFKLWGNMTTNPVSALTGAACDAILDDELVRAFMARGMAEAAAIGAAIGCPIEQSPEDRMAVTRQLGAFKTSMLQDAEAGKRLELDALVGAVREIGQRVNLPMPYIDAIFGLTRLMAQQKGLR